jgi:hypothetical protein
MKPSPVPVGARLIDSLQFSQSGNLAQAQALKAAGGDAVFLYAGVAGPAQVSAALEADLGVLPVTLADAWTASIVAELQALGICPGVSVHLDIEGTSTLNLALPILTTTVNDWCAKVKAAGFIPAGYFGVPQPFTSDEMYDLAFEGYWRGQGSIRDRNNALAEPTGCGWWCYQAYPSQTVGGVLVDYNMVTADFKNRVPVMGVAE